MLAMGRGVGKDVRIAPVQMIDIAPTVAKLLGIDAPAQSVGTAVILGQSDLLAR
jgi:arylsulfatase A-like enzyme